MTIGHEHKVLDVIKTTATNLMREKVLPLSTSVILLYTSQRRGEFCFSAAVLLYFGFLMMAQGNKNYE